MQPDISQLPQAPGVYIFFDAQGKILYIGKAIRLRDRVSQYFGPSYREERKRRMIPQIAKIDFKVTETPIEALLLESELIKKYQPPFNVEWRDDKHYFYLGITQEEAPRIFLTHQPILKHVFYVGPFVEKEPLIDLVRLLLQLFGVQRARRITPKTLAPSATARTREKLATIRIFLKLGLSPLLRDFEKQMKQAAQHHEFERAAYYRDKIKRLERYRRQQQIAQRLRVGERRSDETLAGLQSLLHLTHPPRRIEGYDLAMLAGEAATGAMVVALDGVMVPSEYRQFKIKRTRGVHDVAMLKEVLQRRFQHAPPAGGWPRPDLVLVDGGVPQVATTARLFTALKLNIPFVGLAKREERLVIPSPGASGRFRELVLPRNDRGLQLLQSLRDEAHRFCRRLHHSLRRRGLKN